jgi:hypothetical protein
MVQIVQLPAQAELKEEEEDKVEVLRRAHAVCRDCLMPCLLT